MTFVNDQGEVLDFNGDFAITKQAVSFFNSKIKGDFSVNFRVDNNSVNRKVLNYDGPMMLNQVAFTRQSFTLMRNGNPFARGFLVIQTDLGKELDCYFISGNSNWLNLLNGLITELDYTGVTNVTNYELQLTPANVQAKTHSTSGIIFPFVDWCYNGNKMTNEYYESPLMDAKQDATQSYYDFYPCLYLSSLLSEIGVQKSLKFAGGLLDDRLFKSLVIPPFTGEIKRPRINRTSAYGTDQSTNSAVYIKYTTLTESSDPEDCFSTASYTANINCKLYIITDLVAADNTVGAGTMEVDIAIHNNGVFVAGPFVNLNIATPLTNAGAAVSTITVLKGDVIDLRFRNSGTPGNTVRIRVNMKIDVAELITANDYIKPDQFLPALTCFDIVKFCVANFGCVSYFNEYSKTVTITPIESIREENALDWSAYVDASTIKPDYTIDSAANNYQRLAAAGESDIKAYNKAKLVKFGEGNLETDVTSKDAQDIYKSPFSASFLKQGKNGNWMTNIPLIQLVDSGDPIPYTLITSDGGIGAYTIVADATFIAGQMFRIVDDLDGDIGYHRFAAYFSATQIEFNDLFYTKTSTGRIYPQEIVFNQVGPKILSVATEQAVTNIMASFTAYEILTIGSLTFTSTAHFTKPAIGLGLDNNKANVAFDNPEISGYTDPTINQLYFRKINRMMANPTIRASFLLPESVFQAFDFQNFIYLKTPNLTGYFFVQGITNYQDSNTPVEITLYML